MLDYDYNPRTRTITLLYDNGPVETDYDTLEDYLMEYHGYRFDDGKRCFDYDDVRDGWAGFDNYGGTEYDPDWIEHVSPTEWAGFGEWMKKPKQLAGLFAALAA